MISFSTAVRLPIITARMSVGCGNLPGTFREVSSTACHAWAGRASTRSGDDAGKLAVTQEAAYVSNGID
jgi:hypothetical protein